MSALAQLKIGDLRPKLSVKPNPPGYMQSRRKRVGPIDSATVHYNGPEISFRADIARILNFIVNVDCPNHQSRIGMDSLAYHFVVLDDGSIWQTRDLDLIAWHCAHPYGNEHSIAVHLPIGGNQQPSPSQLASLKALLDALAADYGFSPRAVRGHQEWHSSLCPGVPLMTWLRAYRAGTPAVKPVPAPKVNTRWECINKKNVNVRTRPRQNAEDGKEVPIVRVVKYGDVIEVGAVKTDGDVETIRGDNRWLWLADGSGFVWAGNFKKV